MSVEIQKQIKDNSTGVSEFFQDLYKWTAEQGKEEKRRETRKKVTQGLPVQAPASKENGSSSAKAAEPTGAKKEAPPDEPQEEPIARDKIPMAQYYSSWDRYDVDATLDKIEDEARDQQRAEQEERQAAKDRILDEMALRPDGDRQRTTKARPRVKISVRKSGRRVAPVDLALPKKAEANRLFAEGRFREAIATYTAGLECLDKYEPPGADGEAAPQPDAADGTGQETEAFALKTALLANRALVEMKLEEWREVIVDCTEALRFEPDHHKATLRRGFAFARMKRWPAAARDLEKAVKGDPSDTKAAAELQMARRMLAEQVKEARAHAKNMLRDPTREPKMPTRTLQVQVAQSKSASSPPAPKSSAEVAAAANAAAATAAAAAAAASAPSAAGAEAAAGGAAASAAPAAARKPYVPRSVRMRGRQQAEPVPSARPAAGAGAEASAVPAMSFYAFEGQWARLRGKPRERVALLRRVGANALPALLRESMDSEILAGVAEALASELRDTGVEVAPFAVAAMGSLARTPRFDLSIRGLSVEERQVCSGVLAACAEAGRCGEEDIAALQQAYAPPPPPAPREPDDDEDDVAEPPQPAREPAAAEEAEAPAPGPPAVEEVGEPPAPAVVEEVSKPLAPAAEAPPAPAFSLDDCD